MIKEVESGAAVPVNLVVVQNWPEELKRLVSVNSIFVEAVQQLLERVEMRGQKELVLIASRGLLRFDDVQQASGPHRVEIKSLHHQRKVDEQSCGPLARVSARR